MELSNSHQNSPVEMTDGFEVHVAYRSNNPTPQNRVTEEVLESIFGQERIFGAAGEVYDVIVRDHHEVNKVLFQRIFFCFLCYEFSSKSTLMAHSVSKEVMLSYISLIQMLQFVLPNAKLSPKGMWISNVNYPIKPKKGSE